MKDKELINAIVSGKIGMDNSSDYSGIMNEYSVKIGEGTNENYYGHDRKEKAIAEYFNKKPKNPNRQSKYRLI